MSEVSYKKFYKFFIGIILATLFLYISYQIITIYLLLAISLLIALILKPFVYFLEKQKLSRTLSTFIVFISFLLIIYFSISFLIPPLISQMNQLINTLKNVSFNQEISLLEKNIIKALPFIKEGEISHRIQNFFRDQIIYSLNHLFNFINSIVSFLAFVVIVPFLIFYILKDSIKIKRELVHIFPNRYFEPAYWIIKRVSDKLGKFVTGWIFDASFVGIAIGLGFYVIGVGYSLPLGVIAGIGHLIPYLGPVIGAIPAIIISLIQTGSFSLVPLIILIVAIVYTLDNGFVQPYIFSKSVDMHPLVIILLILAGGQLFGFFGMLFAIPVSTVIKTTVSEIYFVLKNYKLARM
ncbi:MAG: AI-2E family transporter [Ignavibacterium sp.]|nr:AI-2E family transporter [Ignavibacterium sp.]MDW8376508.1 AI-2E family transporter [Ignavibacteriales bacterium]